MEIPQVCGSIIDCRRRNTLGTFELFLVPTNPSSFIECAFTVNGQQLVILPLQLTHRVISELS